MDVATLGIAVDARQVNEAEKALDKLASTGSKAETQAKELSSATDVMAATMRELVSALRDNTSATSANTSAASSNASATKTMSDADKAAASAKRAAADAAREAAQASKTMADAERMAASEAVELADRIARLKASVDPFGFAIDKANAELAEAKALMAQGSISAADYDHAVMTLGSRTEQLAAKQEIANKHLQASRTGFKLTATEGLNFSRQMADIGVTAAMGMNPLMIAIQQGPQLFDIMQTAAVRSGGTISSVFKAVGASIWGALLPVLPVIAAIGVAVGTVAAVWGLASRSVNKSVGDNIDHLKLNEKQLERLKEKGTETGVTMGDSFKALGTTIKEVFVETFGDQLELVSKKWTEFLDFLTVNGAKAIDFVGGSFLGAFYVIRDTWKLLPSAFGDILVTTTNFVIRSINEMVKKGVEGLNAFAGVANGVLSAIGNPLRIGQISRPGAIGELDNPNAGAASNAANAASESMARGRRDFSTGRQGLWDRYVENVGDTRDARVRKDAGDAGRSGSGRDRESEYEKQLKASQEFLKSLKEETAEIGLNSMQIKMAEVEREALAAQTVGLTDEIRKAGQAWRDATNKQATEELRRELADLNEERQFENSLLGMNVQEQEVANAKREVAIRLRDLEREGYNITSEAIKAETDTIIANAEAKGALILATQRAAEAEEDLALRNDRLNSLVSGFGDLFGSQGSAIEDMMSRWTDYGEHVLSVNNRIAEAERQYGEESAQAQRERANGAYELATAQQQYYGDMLSAAKGFFNEQSAGYRILRTAEQAYRIYQFAMKAQAIILDGMETTSHVANAGTRMATDAAETTSSVAKSGVRAAADGVAAFAKTLASLPFPFNLAAGAVVLAALVGVGVAMKGSSGSSKSATSASNDNSTTYSPPTSYTPFVSHDTGTPGYLNHAPISQPVAQGSINRKTNNVFDFSGANFGNQDPETIKQAVRDGIDEARPELLQDARSQNLEDMKMLGRQNLGGAR